uniref:Uncharacterized protein n=1 Tax=Chelonoidis abingdonii TaxID=106734 RepID=A0A8C0JFN6_CHEAB
VLRFLLAVAPPTNTLMKRCQTLKITFKDCVVEFGKGKFHINGNVLFCIVCSKAIDYIKRQTIVEYMESAKHSLNEKKQKQKAGTAGPSTTVKKQCSVTGSFQCFTTAKGHYETVTSDFVQMCVQADILCLKWIYLLSDFLSKHIKGGSAIPKSDQLYSHYLPTPFEKENRSADCTEEKSLSREKLDGLEECCGRIGKTQQKP